MNESSWAEFRRGWGSLLAAFIGNALSAGTLGFYSLGVLAPALQREYGWGAGAVAGGLLAITLTTLPVSPVVGVMVDRYGVKWVASVSAALLALAFCLFVVTPLTIPVYFGLWALVAIAGAGCFPMTWSRLVNQHFQKKRGLALGISFVGTGLTGFFLKPLLFNLIERGGSRAGFGALAVLPLVTLVATLLLVRSTGTRPVLHASAAAMTPAATGATFSEALREWRFWLLTVVVAAAALGVGGPLPNMESVVRSQGFSAAQAVAAAQGVGLAIVLGRIGGGALLDRMWAPGVGAVMLAAGGFGCFLAGGSFTSGLTTHLEVFLIGMAAGLESDLVAFLVVRYFGLKNYASIYGVLYGIFALGTGIGAITFGALYDTFGSYYPALIGFGLVLAFSAIAVLFLGPYRYSERVS